MIAGHMGEGADVLVIGAGIIGCAVARELARRGARVRIFESRSVAGGATQASAGVLAPLIEGHERGPLLDLTLRSLGLYDRFVADVQHESGLAIEYRRCGTLEVATSDAAAERLQDTHRILSAAHPSLAWLDADRARALEPSLPDAISGALHAPLHGYVSVTQLTEALAWAAVRHRVELEAHRRITAVEVSGDRVVIRSEDGGEWTAEYVVIAAGSWTGKTGLDETAATHVRPVRGQILRIGWRGRPFQHILWGPDCYLVPWLDGTVLVGATVEDVGFDERTTAAGVRDLLEAVCDLLPEAWNATFLDARAGLRPATSDGLPIIGKSGSTDRIVYATGHYRNGVLLAPLTAQMVTDLLIEGRSDPALENLRPGRF